MLADQYTANTFNLMWSKTSQLLESEMCDSIDDDDFEGKISAQAPLGGRWDLTAPVVAFVIGRLLK